MTRKVESIRIVRNIVYINFTDGTFGQRILENGTWRSHGINADELAEAKELGQTDRKWHNYAAPRNVFRNDSRKHDPCDGELPTRADELETLRNNAVRGESELAG